MSNKNQTYYEWQERVANHRFVRWEELPDLELYMDQVLIFVEKQLGAFSIDGEKILTSSMINNYVKAGLIPKPHKKKYSKTHLAYIIAITVLKQVIPIIQVRDGIVYTANSYGEKAAYNMFCDEMEHAFSTLLNPILTSIELGDKTNPLKIELATKYLALSFASKMIAVKIIEVQEETKNET
ncbi:MAG: DUF1836 domain-containing protein [Erysipelotrichaceae bacterium]